MALYIYNITIIGTDTYYGENPVLTDITDGKSVTLICNKVNIVLEAEQEVEKYDGGLSLDKSVYNFAGSLEYAPYTNPKYLAADPPAESSGVGLIDYYTFFAPLKKAFKYIFSFDYPVLLQYLWEDSEKGVRVVFAPPETEITQHGLLKYVKLPFKSGSNQ
jgi:hypothetical protein